jgi:biotin transporter BioY
MLELAAVQQVPNCCSTTLEVQWQPVQCQMQVLVVLQQGCKTQMQLALLTVKVTVILHRFTVCATLSAVQKCHCSLTTRNGVECA